jgi:membrane protein DedA with SNARE-associated domain
MIAYLVLAGGAFAAQALLFVPLVPLLVASGALAAVGELRIGWAVAALAAGIAAGDSLWFAVGRRGGLPVLKRVCRLSVEPDSCVRKTQNLFARYGARALLVAKFIPGLSTVALPLAGAFGMRVRRFIAYDAAGVLAWSAAYAAVGYLSGPYASGAASAMTRAPVAVLAMLATGVAAYVGWKYVRRVRAGRRLRRVPRATVAELARTLETGEPAAVVDLRHPIEFERDPYTIPHALRMPAEQIPARAREIPSGPVLAGPSAAAGGGLLNAA